MVIIVIEASSTISIQDWTNQCHRVRDVVLNGIGTKDLEDTCRFEHRPRPLAQMGEE